MQPTLRIRSVTPDKGELASRFLAGVEAKNDKAAEAIVDPVQFSKFFLKSDLWNIQEDILRAVEQHPRVAVKACHASSKTYSAARVVLWFLARFTDAVVVTTAPTWTQVEKLLWGEIHSALLKSIYPFPKATLTELKLGPKRYAYGLSTSVTKQDEGVKFQGIHADNVLVVLDEAPGVDPKIWEAVEGARAGGNVRVLAIGNPTISSGPFHTAFHEGREGWKTFTISAFSTPNFTGITLEQLLKMSEEELDINVRPYLTTRRWVKEKYYEWGPGHPLWESRVLGEFPSQSEDALLSLAWLEQAKNREFTGGSELKAGVDVAGPGEAETSLTIRRGPQILLHKQWSKPDPRGEVVAALLPYKEVLKAVNVDCIGIGWGMYTHLADLKFPTNPVNVCESSRDSEKFCDLKAEYYWGLRMRLMAGDLGGLVDEITIGQLASIRYGHNSRGQVEIESKEKAAKRGVKSPDRAESIMLAFAEHQLVYGAIEYYKIQENMKKVPTSTLIKPGLSDNQLSCPQCTAICVTVAGGGGWRCNQCGYQWRDPDDKVIKIKPVSRGSILRKFRLDN